MCRCVIWRQADADKAAAAAAANCKALEEKLEAADKSAAAAREAEKALQAKLGDLEGAIDKETAPLRVRPQAQRGSARARSLPPSLPPSWRAAS